MAEDAKFFKMLSNVEEEERNIRKRLWNMACILVILEIYTEHLSLKYTFTVEQTKLR